MSANAIVTTNDHTDIFKVVRQTWVHPMPFGIGISTNFFKGRPGLLDKLSNTAFRVERDVPVERLYDYSMGLQ